MAGDWIKMRVNLWTHPKVSRLMKRTGVTRCNAIGALYGAWSVADQHADEDGVIQMSSEDLDDMLEVPGFCNALQSVGWLEAPSEETLQFVAYQEHNGSTAKQRAQSQKRVSKHRSKGVTQQRNSGNADVTPKRNQRREEKRREDIEEKKTQPAAEVRPDQDRSLDESRAAPWQPDIEIRFLAAWEAAEGRIRYPHAQLSPGRRQQLVTLSGNPAWDWQAALAKFPLKCTQGRRDGWRPSLGWFLKEDSVDSILEGAYDWSPNSAGAEDRLAALDRYAAMDDEPEPIDVPNFAEQIR